MRGSSIVPFMTSTRSAPPCSAHAVAASPTELAAKLKADRRLPDGRSSKPGRMPRTQSDRRDCAAGAAECVDQGVAQPGFGRNPHDDDPGHACHRSSTAVTAFSTP